MEQESYLQVRSQHRGINLHAATLVPTRDRARLEQLIRYTSRPPLALNRFERRDDGRVCIRFKPPWDDNDRRKRPAWAALLRRVFAFELEDGSCGGKMRIRSVHTTPASIEAILRERSLWPDDDPRGPPPDFLPAQLSLL